MRHSKRRTGAVTMETALLYAVVAGALLGVSIMMKRHIMGKSYETAQQISDQPFNPSLSTHTYKVWNTGYREETTLANGTSDTTKISDTQTRTGSDGTPGLAGERLF